MTDVVEGVGVDLEDLVLPVYEFYVEGLTPLVMNSPHAMRGPDDALGRKKIPTPEDEAASKAYRTAVYRVALAASSRHLKAHVY